MLILVDYADLEVPGRRRALDDVQRRRGRQDISSEMARGWCVRCHCKGLTMIGIVTDKDRSSTTGDRLLLAGCHGSHVQR